MRTFPGDSVDIRRLVTDNSVTISTDIRHSNVGAKYNQDVRLAGLRRSLSMANY
jgi:hypothetical protein